MKKSLGMESGTEIFRYKGKLIFESGGISLNIDENHPWSADTLWFWGSSFFGNTALLRKAPEK